MAALRGRWLRFEGAGGAIEVTDEAIYLAAAIPNVGTGIAVLPGWCGRPTLDIPLFTSYCLYKYFLVNGAPP